MPSPSQNQPGRLWYTWQYTKAMVKSFSDKKTEKDAKVMAKLGGTTTGVTIAGAALGHYLYIPLLVPFLSSLITLGAAGYLGYKTWQKFSLLKDSAPVRNYIMDRKQEWTDRKNRKSLFTRLKASIGASFSSIGTALRVAGKWAGFAVAAAATGVGGIAAANYFGAGILTAQMGILSAAAVSAGAALGLAAGVSIGVATGLLAVAVPVGIIAGLRCHNSLYVKNRESSNAATMFRPKPAAGAEAGKTAPAQNASPSFGASAAPASHLSPERQKAAEARAAARKARLKL